MIAITSLTEKQLELERKIAETKLYGAIEEYLVIHGTIEQGDKLTIKFIKNFIESVTGVYHVQGRELINFRLDQLTTRHPLRFKKTAWTEIFRTMAYNAIPIPYDYRGKQIAVGLWSNDEVKYECILTRPDVLN